jgi:hypothetical protein
MLRLSKSILYMEYELMIKNLWGSRHRYQPPLHHLLLSSRLWCLYADVDTVRKYPNTFAHRKTVDPSEYTPVWKYPNVEKIKWSNDCPKEYVRGKRFLPNRVLCKLPLGMRRFHDWYYLHVTRTELELVEAVVPSRTFGGPTSRIAFDFSDIQVCFHLGSMSMNLIRTWCL